MALRWQDVDFESRASSTSRVPSIATSSVTPRPRHLANLCPLHPIVVEELKKWKAESMYQSDSDFLFPSIQKNGAQPLQPDMILKRHIRPVLGELGVNEDNWVALIPAQPRHDASPVEGRCEGRAGNAAACESCDHPWGSISRPSERRRERRRNGAKVFFGLAPSASTLGNPRRGPERRGLVCRLLILNGKW